MARSVASIVLTIQCLNPSACCSDDTLVSCNQPHRDDPGQITNATRQAAWRTCNIQARHRTCALAHKTAAMPRSYQRHTGSSDTMHSRNNRCMCGMCARILLAEMWHCGIVACSALDLDDHIRKIQYCHQRFLSCRRLSRECNQYSVHAQGPLRTCTWRSLLNHVFVAITPIE